MRIDSYTFGTIVIDGKTYTSDVIIYHDEVDASWWRNESHRLQASDIRKALDAQPDILIIGTGYAGVMSVPREVASFIAAQGIDVRIEKTTRAVELYNSLGETKHYVIAALHITC